MRAILVILILITTLGCAKNASREEVDNLLNEINRKVHLKLQRLHTIFADRNGNGYLGKPIKLLLWGLNYFQGEIDINTARKLLIIATNEFLNEYNSDERVRPYLATYPLTHKNVQIRMGLSRHYNEPIMDTEKIGYISMLEGQLIYYVCDEKICKNIEIFRESYEAALEKLKNQGELL